MANAAAPLEQLRSITKQALPSELGYPKSACYFWRCKRASIAMQRERRATSQEGNGRDFRVATFIHLCIAATIGPHEAKRTERPPVDGELSRPRTSTSDGHL